MDYDATLYTCLYDVVVVQQYKNNNNNKQLGTVSDRPFALCHFV
jgi:hypothetical protein